MGWGKGGKGFLGGKGFFGDALLFGAEAALVGGAVAYAASRPREPEPVVVVNGVSPEVAYAYSGGKGKGNAHVQMVAPLRVSSIRLPADAMEFRGDVNFFAIDVTSESGAAPSSWRVMRRFNEFQSLADRLGSFAYSFPDAPFPRKHKCGCKGVKLENRRRGLEVWLQRVFEHPSSAHVWALPLQDFVGTAQATYTPDAAPIPTEMPKPKASDPKSATLNPGKRASQEHHAAECEELEIEVPSGVSAGQLLGVIVHGGKQLTFQVPKWAKAGDVLVVVYDPAAGTLRLADGA